MFIDFRNAFDLVWHKSLLYKLRKLGVSDKFYTVIKSMYSQIKLCVQCNDNLTPFLPSGIGVQQGDGLSPILFKLFIDDLPSSLGNINNKVLLGDLKLSCLLYADDLALVSSSQEGLQKSLNSYCEKWGLKVNLEKTKCVVFSKATKIDSSKFFYNNSEVEKIRSYIYLGVKFHASGSFTEAKQNIYNRGLKAYFIFCKAFNDVKTNITTFFHVFDHTVMPVIIYGSEI